MKRTLAVIGIVLIIGIVLYFIGTKQGWFSISSAGNDVLKENPELPTNPSKPPGKVEDNDTVLKAEFLKEFSGRFVKAKGTEKPIFYVALNGKLQKVSDAFYTALSNGIPGIAGVQAQIRETTKLLSLTSAVDLYYFTIIPTGVELSASQVGTLMNN